MEEAYFNLANAIILQALKDYQEARQAQNKLVEVEPLVDKEARHLKWKGRMLEAKTTRKEIEQFFYSEWFAALTDVDGKALLKKVLQMEVA